MNSILQQKTWVSFCILVSLFFLTQSAQSTNRQTTKYKLIGTTKTYSYSNLPPSNFTKKNQLRRKKLLRFALIVGVGAYPRKENVLKSPPKDAKRIERILRKKDFQIKRLLDSEATVEKVREGMKWLVKNGQDPASTLVFYYSGHGHQIDNPKSPEADKKDETLFPYGVASQKSSVGHITDKEINALSKQIKGRALFIFDSCHSGDSTKTAFPSVSWDPQKWVAFFHSQIQQKRYCEQGCTPPRPLSASVLSALEQDSPEFSPPPALQHKSSGFSVEPDEKITSGQDIQGNVLLLSAALDSEKALDLENGSMLTNAILYVLRKKEGFNLTHQQFYDRVKARVRWASKKLITEMCKQQHDCFPKLKEIQDYLKTANYTAQQPQLEGSTALKDSKLFFLDGDENSKETDKKETTITVYLDGFKPEATKIWTTILAPYHAKVLPHKKDTEVSISHDGKTLYVFYKNRLFLALPADESRANDLQKDLKRIFYAIQLVKQWSQFHQTTSALQTNILLFQKKSYIPLQGETIEIGSGIRIQILSTKLCYPVVFNLTNEGQMLVIHPYPQNEPITRIHKTITIPPKGKFRVKEPKGLGLIMAFCSAKKSDVEMLRKRIIRGKYKPPSYLNSRVQRNIISYYVQ